MSDATHHAYRWTRRKNIIKRCLIHRQIIWLHELLIGPYGAQVWIDDKPYIWLCPGDSLRLGPSEEETG